MRLVLFLYNITLTVLSPLAFVIGFPMAKFKGHGKGFGERFGLIRLNKSPRTSSVWFHTASVGEARSIKNIVDKIREERPDTAIIVSTMTTTGRATAKTYLEADEAFLLPIENAPAIKYLIKLMGVKILFIVDTEIWPNMITAAAKETVVIMINARISQRTYKSYMRFRFLFKYVLKKFTKIFTKSSEDFERFKNIIGNDTTIETAGNIKFQSRKNIADIKPLKEFENQKIFLAASTHPSEEEFILKNLKDKENLFDKIIIVPRHTIRSGEIKKIAENLNYKASLYSEKNFDAKVIIIDAFGILESLYIISDKIFIGGSIAPIGGHNIYEAIQFYKTVACGTNVQNFNEIFQDAQTYRLAEMFVSPDEFSQWITNDEKMPRENFDMFFKLTDEKNEKIAKIIADEAIKYLDEK